MTANQINYWTLQENKRHNIVGERENTRHNMVTEGETQRHNIVTENVSISNLYESQRHNMATEELGRSQLAETQRHAKVTEAQTDKNIAENVRHNKKTEFYTGANLSETQRHNLREEMAKRTSLSIEAFKAKEAQRHNYKQEDIALVGNALKREGLRIEEAKNEAQAAYNNAMASVRRAEVQLQGEQNAAVREKLKTEIAKLEQDIKSAKTRDNLGVWDRVLNTANTITSIVDTVME
nr:putative ORF1 [Marmot picobirnavirus]